jgi:hypothetical protein
MTRTRLFPLGILLVTSLVLTGQGIGQPLRQETPDERELQKAGIDIDGPALLEYFRRRTPSDAEQKALKQRAQQLGSDAFPLRRLATDELIRAGRSSLPYLRDMATHKDAETARRASYCIQAIEQHTRLGLSATASRVLAERNVSGALETLLAYLPFVDEPWVEEEVRMSIKRLGLVGGKAAPVLEQALGDPESKRRVAAAWIVGLSTDSEQRAKVLPRLADAAPEVRFHAAASLLASRESAAVPTLIDLVGAPPLDLAWRAEDLLFRVAGDQGPSVWLDRANDNSGAKVKSAWIAWWNANQSRIDWKALTLDEQALGLTLVVENQRADGGRLYETNAAGQVRWEISVQNPIDAQWLPGGRILVGDSRSSLIYETDTRGNIGWRHTGISPTSLQRLANGNTVVSTYQKILEINREGRIVFEYATQGHTYHARKLPDNHYVWIDACGEIGEIDETGKLLAKAKVGGGLSWGSIERLRNGRYLVALGGVGKVQEIDMAGKVYWEKTVPNPNRAVRLANGHILVASHGDGCVYEFDANGNERWKHPCAGRPFAVQRR